MNLNKILTAAVLLPTFVTFSAAAADMKLEAELIWGTSEAKKNDSKLKPADAAVREKLSSLPLKWTSYYEVKRQRFGVADAGSQRVELSDKCTVEVKNIGKDKVEVALFGKGQPVWKGTQPLPKNEILVLGGNAPAESAWLVTLKRIE